MNVVISLLRGINVGGHHQIKMEALRALYGSLGLQDVQTHIQSGNVVFRTGEQDLALLAKRIEDEIERSFGFRPSVIGRTASELRSVIARNPFADRQDTDPSKLLVLFLASEPDADARDAVLAIPADPEELRLNGRELYIYFPDGMARPKLSLPRLEKALKTPGTGRNWNTVMKLLAMAEKMETS